MAGGITISLGCRANVLASTGFEQCPPTAPWRRWPLAILSMAALAIPVATVLLSSREVGRHTGGLIQWHAFSFEFDVSSYFQTTE